MIIFQTKQWRRDNWFHFFRSGARKKVLQSHYQCTWQSCVFLFGAGMVISQRVGRLLGRSSRVQQAARSLSKAPFGLAQFCHMSQSLYKVSRGLLSPLAWLSSATCHSLFTRSLEDSCLLWPGSVLPHVTVTLYDQWTLSHLPLLFISCKPPDFHLNNFVNPYPRWSDSGSNL